MKETASVSSPATQTETKPDMQKREYDANTHVCMVLPKLADGLIYAPVSYKPEGDSAEFILVVPAESDILLHKWFGVQGEYENESKFRAVAVPEAIKDAIKVDCSGAIAAWERLIAKCQQKNSKFNREQAIEHLRATSTGKRLEQFATLAEALKAELS